MGSYSIPFGWLNLMLSMLGKIFLRPHIEMYFFFLIFLRKEVLTAHANGLYMKCQILFPGKNNRNISNLSSA